MVQGQADAKEFSTRSLRLGTLVNLRWLAVLGQSGAVLLVRFGFGFHLPLAWCLGLVAVSALLNALLRLRLPATYRLDGLYATALLGYDILQLGVLLFLTGGLANPFAFLLLAPVMVSAATMPQRSTVLLGLLVAALATVLAMVYWPLPWAEQGQPILPPLYLAGIWLSLVSTLAFTGIYAFRVAEEGRQLAEALSSVELVLQREQHLTALDGLAAAAAHELGTPLGTIAVVARELERELPPGSPMAEDIALLRSQSDRCREILRKLTSLGSAPDLHFVRMPLSSLIEEVTAPFRDFGTEITVATRGGSGPEPVGTRNPGILYGLGNIVENAIDFARAKVEIVAEWDLREVSVTISDDGPGFSPEVIDRIGEPYVTTREKINPRPDGDETGGGLGLGYFIANTLLMRSGARLVCANKRAPESGAQIRITWPRALMDIPARDAEAS